jgi:hypothetical protein
LCHSAKIVVLAVVGIVAHVAAEIAAHVVVEIVAHVAAEIARRETVVLVVHARPEIVALGHRERIAQPEIVRQGIAALVAPGQWEIGPRVRRERKSPLRAQRRRVPKRPVRLSRLHRQRRNKRLRPVLLRASRGDTKPCYWHRHVPSTANSIAVA